MKKASEWFKTETRGEGDKAEKFICLDEGAPQWLKDAVYGAHDSASPSDWVYEECKYACIAVEDGDDDHEHADGRVDIYTGVLFQWAADFCGTSLFAGAEDEAREMGDGNFEHVEDALKRIQYCAILSIMAAMKSAIEENEANEDADA